MNLTQEQRDALRMLATATGKLNQLAMENGEFNDFLNGLKIYQRSCDEVEAGVLMALRG